MTGCHDHAPLTYGRLFVDKYLSHGNGARAEDWCAMITWGYASAVLDFAIGSVRRNNGIYGGFLMYGFFLFAVISMHHTVHQLVYGSD